MEGRKITKGVQVQVSIVVNAGEKKRGFIIRRASGGSASSTTMSGTECRWAETGVWLDVDWRFFVMLLFYGPNLWKEALGASPTNDIL